MRPESSPIDRATRPGGPGLLGCCAYLLLIASAVQGITPDLDDLASSRAFHLLFGAIPPAQSFRGDATRHAEAGVPVGVADFTRIRREARQAHEAGFVLAAPADDGLRSGALDVHRPRPRSGGAPGEPDRLIHLLCHLTC